MKENEARGGLSYTPNDHRKIGSSGSGFEYLIKGQVKPDVPFGEQMTDEALKKYYDYQLGGVHCYFNLTSEQRKMVWSVAEGFELDLPYLESRGINTREAKSVFEQLKKLG